MLSQEQEWKEAFGDKDWILWLTQVILQSNWCFKLEYFLNLVFGAELSICQFLSNLKYMLTWGFALKDPDQLWLLLYKLYRISDNLLISLCPFVSLSLNECVWTKIWSKETNDRANERTIERLGVGRPLLGPAKHICVKGDNISCLFYVIF